MADPLERITNLLALLLETREPLTLAQIGHRLGELYPAGESARRTAFERDKAMLRAEGIPIDQVVLGGDRAGQTGYRIDRRHYELADLGLTTEERNALQLAVATVGLGTDWGTQAMWKLGGEASAGGSALLRPELPASPALPVIADAIAARATVTFGYHGRERHLDPYSLLARSGWWYLIGHDHTHDDVRVYRVDRIETAVTPGEENAFERPAGFDPRSAFGSDRSAGEATPDHAEVWIAPGRAAQVIAELGDEAVLRHGDDGSVVVRVAWTNLVALRAWVLDLLDQAEVLAPAELRAEIVSWLEAIG